MKKSIKIIILALVLIALGYLFVSQGNSNESVVESADTERGIKIVSTLFPLHDLAQAIGGDRVTTTLLLPPGMSPHAFEPTPSDMLKISQADFFIYTGENLEPWAGKLLNSLNVIPNSLVLGQNLNTLELSDDHGHEHEDGHEDHPSDEHEEELESGLDPHIWLDPLLMMEMADRFTNQLVALDVAGTDYYLSNLASYKNSLEQLDADFREALADCRHREIIYGGHYAFGYLAKRYNLDYEAAQGFSPDAESSPTRLVDLVKMLKDHQVNYLFAAQMDNPQLSETLAQEAQVEILTLHTVHNLSQEERDRNLSYENLMRLNLKNLKQGLECR
jgi:zinc transport system substrate-binding protein